MTFKIQLITFAIFAAFAAGLPQGSKHMEHSKSLLKDAFNSFNQKIYSKLAESENGNTIFSPFSLHLILSQIFYGAPTGSDTNKELGQLLGLDSKFKENYLQDYLKVIESQQQHTSNSTGVIINIAKKLYVNESFQIKENFKNAMNQYYKSDIEKVNFAENVEAVAKINQFAKGNTKGLIEKILENDDVNDETALVLINAIYFKGNWKHAFNIKETREKTFHIDSKRQVPYMAMKMSSTLGLAKIPEIGATVLELPYQNELLSMIIILPDQHSNVKEVEKKLGKLNLIVEKLSQTENIEVDVVIPKFEIEYEWKMLPENLEGLGVKSVFDKEKSNLTDIADEKLFASKVAHKAIIKVNEEGSEAAAVSVAVIPIVQIASFEIKEEFIVDRPFIISIYDKIDNIPLFTGRIVDPNGKLTL